MIQRSSCDNGPSSFLLRLVVSFIGCPQWTVGMRIEKSLASRAAT